MHAIRPWHLMVLFCCLALVAGIVVALILALGRRKS
jgi:hypothetical protein